MQRLNAERFTFAMSWPIRNIHTRAKDIEALRTLVAVPMLKGEDLLGVIDIYHLDEVRPFTDKANRSA